jgi:hypothetical protein
MKATDLKIIDSYFELLDKLNSDSKLELISRLAESLKTQPKTKEKSVQELFGAYISEKSAETIIKEIRESRN